jgi:hypothetical protein
MALSPNVRGGRLALAEGFLASFCALAVPE